MTTIGHQLRYTPRVLMIVHDPLVTATQRLHQYYGWHNPRQLAQQYIADIQTASHGAVQYQVVNIIDAPWFPVKIDGFQYDVTQYINGWRQRRMHHPDGLDYQARIAAFDLYGRVRRDEFDEVWFFSPPYAGEYESIMVGPGAFWCNAPAIATLDAAKRFVMMGFNYERDVGCMLENFGHRVESIMHHVYTLYPQQPNLWQAFCQYELTHPQASACGNVHFAPNSRTDYEWNNRTQVWSTCDRWRDFPASQSAPARLVDCREWGNGDMWAHHIWWLQHLPHTPAMIDGVWGDWWRYCIDPNTVVR